MKDFFEKEFKPTEMYKLINLLIKRKQNFEVREHFDAPQVIFLNEHEEPVGVVICHSGSYGHEQGLLKIMGLDLEDDVEGYLTAEDVLKHFDNLGVKTLAHWEERFVNDKEYDPIGWFRRRWYCSVCGQYNTYGPTEFCPNCGKRMRKEVKKSV